MAKKTRIFWADSIAIDALEPHVQDILAAMAEFFEMPGIENSFVSDESKIWDFMPVGYFNEDRKNLLLTDLEIQLLMAEDIQRKRTLVRRIRKIRKIPGKQAAINQLAQVSAALGIDIGVDDHLYEAAVRLRDKQ